MPYLFQTSDRSGNPHPRWRFQYTDWRGKRRSATGTTSRAETLKLALRKENEEYEIRKGIRSRPKLSIMAKTRDFKDVASEYFAWGEAQGGRGGRPWSRSHRHMRHAQLGWWEKHLQLQCLGDLADILPKVEARLRSLRDKELAGRTIQSYAETLRGFCRWCVKRSYLDEDPLKNLSPFDTTPETVRRAMNLDEIDRLLNAVSLDRRLLYQVAVCSGLRAGELRSLSIDDLDILGCGLCLRPDWTKNRKSGFQPLPGMLVGDLVDFAASGEAARLYAKVYARKDTTRRAPERPLLYLPSNTARPFDRDLEAASIEKYTKEGKLDFHALRVTYVTLLLQAGAYIKEAQSLARHSDPKLTMNVYARAIPQRLTEIVETVGQPILEDKRTIQA